MKRLALILAVLGLLAGCAKQPEYGPKAPPPPPRYTSESLRGDGWSNFLMEYRDSLTGETWLILTDRDDYATILRHTGSER